jgi:RimJ/RimL family protein N-acetyltransferase
MLKGELVTLSGLRLSDSESLYNWVNDPELARNNAPYTPVHEIGHTEWFKSITNRPTVRIFGMLAQGRLIGSCQLFDIHPVHRSAELQIRISEPQDRGMGYGTDAVKTLLRFAENDLGLHSVWLRFFADNEAARKCYIRAGMQSTGILPEYAFINGFWKDMVIMSIVFRHHTTRQNHS